MSIIILSGSSKFRKQIEQVHASLTLQGNIVISPPFFERRAGLAWTGEQIKLMNELQFKKIDLSDELYIIDVDGCIEGDTRKEIAYAEIKGKKVRYYSQECEYEYVHKDQQQTNLWDQALKLIAREIKSAAYNTWFQETKGSYDGETFVIECANEFSTDWLYERYAHVVLKAAEQVTGSDQVKISFQTRKTVQPAVEAVDKLRVVKIG